MDPAVTTGIFSVAGTAGGTLLGYAINALTQRSAIRSAERQHVQDLFVLIAKGIGTMETERAVFRERRDSPRANFIAAGSAILHAIAGRLEGNWVKGAASGVGALAAWDAAEGARFTDRYQAAAVEVSTALVQLSLISPELQQVAGQMSDALAATVKARKPRDVDAAQAQVSKAVAALRAAVTAHASRKWWHRGRRPSIEAGQVQQEGAPATGLSVPAAGDGSGVRAGRRTAGAVTPGSTGG